jgi:hypothetical protein
MKSVLYKGLSLFTLLFFTTVKTNASSIDELHKEIKQMQKSYESRIDGLESKLKNIESTHLKQTAINRSKTKSRSRIFGNDFNPSIGVVLNGKYQSFSENSSDMVGFGTPEEGERGKEGIALDESEINFSANIDDKFFGSLTAAIVTENGSDSIELEEAFIQTRPEFGLPTGLNLKVGRAFWNIGYLNEHHTHEDDFADRPLPYRVFLNKGFNDDGVEASYVLPIDFYTQIGGGVFRGDDYPSGTAAGANADNYSLFTRIGGDIGIKHNWRLGLSTLQSDSGGRKSNEDNVTFIGDSNRHVA